ncbi:hypothetical protein [Pseudactinotalea suaedae]|jgi:hypothetical protein|uniref:hypothetical protein n=1 Tax=Pseudactinotalea suaedae TaxID=1524924 RepID=UPI0012E12ABC|nr:hypothetical protein [Pseudactinotalea suaedae]
MIWLGLMLLGCAVADIVNRPQAPRVLPEATGAAVVVLAGVVAGQHRPLDLLVLVVIAAFVVAWSRSSTRALDQASPVIPLTVLGVGVGLMVVLSGLASPVSGPLAALWSEIDWPPAARVSPERALLVLGVLAAQLSTGNVVVRLVLAATRTVNPARWSSGAATDPADPAHDIKGGRLLGPMERVLIIGLGLAGNLTAASIVVAAKGLLRFPELSSRRDQEHVHRLTEYFLVGSFVSWMLALVSLALLAG